MNGGGGFSDVMNITSAKLMIIGDGSSKGLVIGASGNLYFTSGSGILQTDRYFEGYNLISQAFANTTAIGPFMLLHQQMVQ